MILKDLAVKTGQYEKNGEMKNRWKTVGHLHDSKNGQYITIDASVNFAAFPRRDGDDRVFVSMFDTKRKTQTESLHQPAQQPDDFDQSDIPF